MNLDFNYTGKTLLKNWWQIVKNNFQSVQVIFNTHQAAQIIDHPDKSVTEQKIADKAISAEKIADSAVSTAKIADSAVKTSKIGGGAVTEAKILDGAVTSSKIGNKAVETRHIADLAVGSEQIQDLSVTAEKLSKDLQTDVGVVPELQRELNDEANIRQAAVENLQDQIDSLTVQNSGQQISVDSSLKRNSENPVQNKVITAALDSISEENLSGSLSERIGDMYGYKDASVAVSVENFTLEFACTDYEIVGGEIFGKLLCDDLSSLYGSVTVDGKRLRGEISSFEIEDIHSEDIFEISAAIDTSSGILQSLSYSAADEPSASYPYVSSNTHVVLGYVSMKDVSKAGDIIEQPFATGSVTVSGGVYGDLSELETTDKSSIISAINENCERISALESGSPSGLQTDEYLSPTSVNPVQNWVITSALEQKAPSDVLDTFCIDGYAGMQSVTATLDDVLLRVIALENKAG